MSSSLARRRNPRGAGGQLRAEIVAAARELLIETGTDSAVTLRAVGRRVGIAAPSIYAHFQDADQIVQAVVGETFTAFVHHLEQARAQASEPRERLVASCRAYLSFGAEQPSLYALLFSRPRPPAATPSGPHHAQQPHLKADTGEDAVHEIAAAIGDGRPGDLVGGESFALLVRDVASVIADGSSRAENPLRTATELWVAMHGLVLLRATAPQFPWPHAEQLETELIERLALLEHDAGFDQQRDLDRVDVR